MAPSEDRVAGATEEFCLKRTENAGKTCSRDFNQNFSLNDVVPKGICCTLSTYDMHLSLLGILNSQRRSICSLYSPYFIITIKKKKKIWDKRASVSYQLITWMCLFCLIGPLQLGQCGWSAATVKVAHKMVVNSVRSGGHFQMLIQCILPVLVYDHRRYYCMHVKGHNTGQGHP